MLFNTNVPEMDNFDPEFQSLSYPNVGIYSNVTFKVIASEPGETKKKEGKFDITFEAVTSEIAGRQFKITYNVGNSNADTAKWAFQDVCRIYYAITGIKPNRSTPFHFDDKLYFKNFLATLEVTEKPGTDKNGNSHDSSGKPIMFKSCKLNGFKHLGSMSGVPIHEHTNAHNPNQNPVAASWGAPRI